MRKWICIVLTLALLLTTSVSSFAVEPDITFTQEQMDSNYAKYLDMLLIVNVKHGLDHAFPSYEEFEALSQDTDQFLLHLMDLGQLMWDSPQETDPPAMPTGERVCVVADTILKTHLGETISVIINGYFEISRHPDGTYYIASHRFVPSTKSDGGSVHYLMQENGSVTAMTDQGRTMVVTTKFDIFVDGVPQGFAPIDAYFYFNPRTGALAAM